MEWAIKWISELLRASADTEFRTTMGVLNFVLTLVVFIVYIALFVTRAVVSSIWGLLMRLLDLLFGSVPGHPPPPPRLPSLPRLLACVLGEFIACIVTIGSV